MYCFIYFLRLYVYIRYRLDVVDFDNLQDLEEQDFEKQVGEHGKWSLNMLILCSFSL
jgi:hypothetical protein